MRGKSLFLKWALSMCLVAIAAFIGIGLGWSRYVADDPTHITLGTIVVFLLATAWCGNLAWKLSNGYDPADVDVELAHGWFASSLCVTIGLIGTAVGYAIMLKGGMTVGDPGEFIRLTSANAGIAIINTVVGAICGAIVELQSHFIGVAVKKALREKVARRVEARRRKRLWLAEQRQAMLAAQTASAVAESAPEAQPEPGSFPAPTSVDVPLESSQDEPTVATTKGENDEES